MGICVSAKHQAQDRQVTTIRCPASFLWHSRAQPEKTPGATLLKSAWLWDLSFTAKRAGAVWAKVFTDSNY